MPFVTAEQLQELVASDLQKADPNDLGVSADTFDRAVTSAQQEIRGRLLARGYTDAQVTAWDRLEEYHGIVSRVILWGLSRSIAAGYDPDTRKEMSDRRKELDTVGVFVGGELVNPDRAAKGDPGGSVGYGRMGGVSDECCRFPGRWPDQSWCGW